MSWACMRAQVSSSTMPEPRGPLACLCHRRTGGHRFGLRVEHGIQPFAEALFIPNFVHSVKEVSTYLRSVARADGWRTEDHVDPVAALVEIAAEPPAFLTPRSVKCGSAGWNESPTHVWSAKSILARRAVHLIWKDG